ncbi:MAG: glycosyltransferase family 4 protein [Candidatus Hydrogenedentes bacterium]|nr:glycosyltransferase family 4 protein [Candidatus Hydrogenedentota bacterium]
MRLAFVDLVFTWPPAGGAPLDLYHTAKGLQQLGHDVHLFFAHDTRNWGIDTVAQDKLPFPSTGLDFTPATYTPANVPGAFREVVDAWRPDVVFICFGFFMKPFVIEALAHYPTVSRYYAYEPACPRDYRIFKNDNTCPNNYLTTPDACRKCMLDFFAMDIRRGAQVAYTRELLATRAYAPSYYERCLRALDTLDAAIVYNHIGKAHLEGFHDNVLVVPGGVNADEFPATPPPVRGGDDKAIILMTGRATDPSKGFGIVLDVGEALYKERQDFQIWVTYPDGKHDSEWLKAIGWLDNAHIAPYYQQADICVVPSFWEEPFGIVAVEAMATGRPVCVSRVGGLQEIVVHGETGFIHDRFDREALKRHLAALLDSPDLRRRMGEAGRRRVVEHYDWRRVIETHYPPLLESLAP